MKHLFLLVAALVAIAECTSAQAVYQASSIPKELLPYASAVVRNLDVTTEIKSLDNMLIRVKETVTVLNKNGDHEAAIEIYYNKLRKLKYIKGTIYNEFGVPVSKLTEKNFSDHSAASDASLFEDWRVKYFKPAVTSYPYTLEYEYEISSRQSLAIPEWNPNSSIGVAVQHSTYQFISKAGYQVRYKTFNYNGTMRDTTTDQGIRTCTWEISNLKALRYEPYSPAPEAYQTIIKFAPEQFSYDGYNGSFTNWKELGQWVNDKLLTGKLALGDQTVKYIHDLTDSISDPKKKAKAIYEYMQGKTRYISIQVGIGGFQPFPATEVDNLSYGDCKALVNYTQALLKVAGIESYYCIVNAGADKRSLLTDFASMDQANHVILCLPFAKDTTWLECTNKKIPFGFLGDFTDDRWVLACTSQGGKLLHTPQYTAAQSRQVRIAELTLNENGLLSGTMKTTFEGCQYENRPLDMTGTPDEVKELKENYHINNLEIEKLNIHQNKEILPVNDEMIKFTARDYGSQAQGKLIFFANLANRRTSVPREVRNRNNTVNIVRGYTDVDQLMYNLPAGYHLENNLLNVNINKPFGKFNAVVTLKDDKLIYKRTLQINDGTYPKESYEELVDFYAAVAKADEYMVSLTKAN